MQQYKLIILSNFYSILSCCLNLFFKSNMLFCMYIHVTVLYYILVSFQKIKNVDVNVIMLIRGICCMSVLPLSCSTDSHSYHYFVILSCDLIAIYWTCNLINICKNLARSKNTHRVVLNQVYSLTPLLFNVTISRWKKLRTPQVQIKFPCSYKKRVHL